MTNRDADASQGEGGNFPPQPPDSTDNQQFHCGNKVYKSGPLFVSSKGIGWTSWKKRWFILTHTSLVFFRSDPTAVPQRPGEANLTLGGIDLNSSGSIVVKEDKKLLTVLFPDGRDGRTFTLKAETLEDLLEWKVALEEALANAPSAACVIEQNGMFRNDQGNATDVSLEQSKDRQAVKSLVIGQPVLLALEDIDGNPSFLEKALQFIEKHGVKVEGILRQAADVDDVEHRIREYEQGKVDFSPDEDGHVIGDCIKYILREMPSSPVPASCCNALLEAFRTEQGKRVNAMRLAILEMFPEPNRRLLQRMLIMMQNVVTHKNTNRMSTSAVAACMAPLLLRPLLAGECDIDNNLDMGDGSVQLLKAAAAANHAQAIIITLLEEYDNIFGEGSDSLSPELYSESDGSGTGSEEYTEDDGEDDDESYEDDGSDENIDDNSDNASYASTGESEVVKKNVQGYRDYNSISNSSEASNDEMSPSNEAIELFGTESAETSTSQKSTDVPNGPTLHRRRKSLLGRAHGRKNLSMESIDVQFNDEDEIQRLEATKTVLQNRIDEEAKSNAVLQENLEKLKNSLHERRLALQKHVARLQKQLQKEREFRMVQEAGHKNSQGSSPISNSNNETNTEPKETAQVEADVIKPKQRADGNAVQRNKQREQNSRFHVDGVNPPQTSDFQRKVKSRQRDVDSHVASQARESRKHGTSLNKVDNERDRKQESDKQHSQSKQSDSVRFPNVAGAAAILKNTPSVPGAAAILKNTANVPGASAILKNTGSKIEGANTALVKLTNRLNFLKERRTQNANEPETLDKGRNSGPLQPLERKGSDPPQAQMLENTGSNTHQVTRTTTYGQSHQNRDRE